MSQLQIWNKNTCILKISFDLPKVQKLNVYLLLFSRHGTGTGLIS